MQPTIDTVPHRRFFLGMEYYGPFSGEGWSAENPIGQLWRRWEPFYELYADKLEPYLVDPDEAYEIMIWNEDEFETDKRFYVFVGVEVSTLSFDAPVHTVMKVIPPGEWAKFTVAGEGITSWEQQIFGEWQPGSNYALDEVFGYKYHLVCYESGRFKGLGDLLQDSEIDVFLPVVPKPEAVRVTG